MAETTFFTIGGTVQAGGGQYVERKVDEELITLCRQGTFGFVLTARQMGKSSLMVRTAERLSQEGTRSVIIDLSQLGVQVSPNAWYLGLLTRIEDALDLDTDAFDWWEKHEHLGLTQRLTQFFQHVLETEVKENVVIFIDEIDSTLSLPFTDDFFAAIRYVYNARSQVTVFNRLTFVLIGVASPNDLISDAQRTPFNIGHQVDVEYFTIDEAMPLANGFELPYQDAKMVLGWILSWTGGHPYLTQRLCATVASAGTQALTKSELDSIVAATFFGQKSEEDSNLRFVQDMLVRRAEDPNAVLSAYHQIISGRTVGDDKSSSIIAHLKLSGVVGRMNGSLAVKNQIYATVFDRKWVKQQWPEHWIKRVPPAVMGLVTAMFIAVVLLGLFFIQRQRAEQAEERRFIQEELNARLAVQAAVSDSLRIETEATNVQLAEQFAVTDSIRLQEVAANAELTEQIALSDRLRQQSEELRLLAEAANERLTEQIGVSDSLRTVAESLLEGARESRIETITIALASHAMRQLRLGDHELGALLARQAYEFSKGGQGAFIAPVHEALMASLDQLGEGPTLAGYLNSASVRSVSYGPDDTQIVWADEAGSLTLASMNGSDVETRVLGRHRGGARTVAYSPAPNSGLVASGGQDGAVMLWSNATSTDSDSETLGNHSGGVWSIAFSPNGDQLASGGADTEIKVWDVESRRQLASIQAEGGRIRALRFSPAAPLLAAACEDGSIRIWDLRNPQTPPTSWQTGQGRLQAIAFSPDGAYLASGGTTTEIRIWTVDPRTGEWSIGPVLQGHEGPINALAFSPDGAKLASASSDHSVQVWDLAQPRVSPILIQGHSSWVWSLAFRSDGSALVTAGADKQVSTWYVDLARMADRVCPAVGARELTRDEWIRFVGVDVPYAENYKPCGSKANSEFGIRHPELNSELGAVNK